MREKESFYSVKVIAVFKAFTPELKLLGVLKLVRFGALREREREKMVANRIIYIYIWQKLTFRVQILHKTVVKMIRINKKKKKVHRNLSRKIWLFVLLYIKRCLNIFTRVYKRFLYR